jgi:N6-adenosine-specific RNA methylase IME4
MKKYKTIYVDPPWDIKKIKRRDYPNQVDLDYPTMSLEEIRCFPIKDLADENSVCFLWTIQSYLPESFKILESWGFKYLLTLAWDKMNGLCLYGFHWRTEFLLFGYRGKLEIYQQGWALPTSFSASSPRHSEKPSIVRTMIEKFEEPRLEVFARHKTPGWDIWGNELDNDIKIELNLESLFYTLDRETK